MASPQLEHGYTKIANEIVDSLVRWQFSSYEWRCLLFIIRKTYGWGKKKDWISLDQFVFATGIKRPHVCRALRMLISQNIITKRGTGNKPLCAFNKDFDTWKRLPKGVRTHTPLPKGVTTITKRGNPSLPKGAPTKETLTKETLTKEIPPNPQMGEGGGSPLQKLVLHFFQLKGWTYDSSQRSVFKRHLRAAKDLLELSNGSLDGALGRIQQVAYWADAKKLDWTIDTVIKKWFDLDHLATQVEKDKVPFIGRDRAYQKDGDWYVIIQTGEHRRFIGDLNELHYETK